MLALDLACPIQWKRAQDCASKHGAAAGSPTPKRQPALDASKTAIDSADLGRTHDIDDDNGDGDHDESRLDQEWLQRRYHEVLWLGEEHSPLIAFLQHLRRFEKRRQVWPPEQLIAIMSRLLQTRQHIRKRFAAAALSISGGGGGGGGTGPSSGEMKDFLDAMVDAIVKLASDDQGHIQRQVLIISLESGPGALVRAELGRSAATRTGLGKLTRHWLQAMECRE